MNSTHPFRVTTRQVVVHRDEMHALTRQAIEIRRQSGDQGLAFTRFHFGNPAEVQRCSTHQLHVIVTLPNDAVRSFANDRECFDQKIIKGFTPLESGTEFSGLATQRVVRQ